MDPRTNLTFTRELMELHMPNFNFVPIPNTFHELPWSGQASLEKPKGI